jgi:ammonium transporter, Amt family
MRKPATIALSFALLLPLMAGIAAADETPTNPDPTVIAEGINGADTAWMLVASALVLMMTAPGLALFYGGLVRKKNILGVMMQCVFLMGLMSVLWALYGYSLAFGPTIGGYQVTGDDGQPAIDDDGNPVMEGGWIGGLDYVCLQGVTPALDKAGNAVYPMSGGIPTLLFMVFQGMFFIITPALICGAFAERMKFSTMCVFMVLWGTFVYCPLAHWVWGGGLFRRLEPDPLDFAGGLVVHLSSGISALLVALLIGKRLGFGQEPMPPHNLTYTTIGAALLWVGWFGFNAGSQLAADAVAVNAFVATHLAAAAGVLAWSACEWIQRGHPSILGACSGAVAGLVCITPACGTCTPMAGIILGLAAGVVCYLACTKLKNAFGYDDSLDAFGVHGVGGTLGAILVGVFASKSVNPAYSGLLEGNAPQLVSQLASIGIGLVLSVVMTLIILKVLDATMGLRVSQQEEIRGLDISQHGEEGYIFL